MKKLLVCLLLSVSLPSFADIAPPFWSEFCPAQYVNASKVDVPSYNNLAHSLFAGATMGLSLLVSIPAGQRRRAALTNNYWVNRRLSFEPEIGTCNVSTGDKALCYTQVRQLEAQKNAAHAQEVQLELLRRQMVTETPTYRPAPTHYCVGSTCYPN